MKLLPEYHFTKPMMLTGGHKSTHWNIYRPNDQLLTSVSTRISAKALVTELNYLHTRLRLVQQELDDLKSYYALQPTLFHQLTQQKEG